MSARVENWPQALNSFIVSRRGIPFEWGTNDCCQFGRGACAVQLGRDPAANVDLLPYCTALGAYRALARIGGIEALPGLCGLEETPMSHAQRGFLMLFDFARHAAMGVCNGERSIFVGPRGLVFVPTMKCRRAWKL